MAEYTELIKALRHCGKDLMPGERCKDSCPYGDIALCLPKLKLDAAAAIEAFQAEVKRLEPKRGEWELIDGAEPMRWGCSRCKYLSWETSNYCPRCGAKMNGEQNVE